VKPLPSTRSARTSILGNMRRILTAPLTFHY
jgi:hypothetical protein